MPINSENLITRRVLFEKIGMSHRLLCDFNRLGWELSEQAISSISKLEERSKTAQLLGEFYMEQSECGVDIKLSNVSHYVYDLSLDKNRLYGDIVFLETHSGRIAKQYYELNQLDSNVRATGYIQDNGNNMLHELITIDVVKKIRNDKHNNF